MALLSMGRCNGGGDGRESKCTGLQLSWPLDSPLTSASRLCLASPLPKCDVCSAPSHPNLWFVPVLLQELGWRSSLLSYPLKLESAACTCAEQAVPPICSFGIVNSDILMCSAPFAFLPPVWFFVPLTNRSVSSLTPVHLFKYAALSVRK